MAGDIVNHGDFDVAGDVALAGDLTLDAPGSINFLLGGSLAGQFGSLAITGDVNLGGELDISLTSGFVPTEGDVLEIIDVEGALTGLFAGLSDGALVGNFGGTDLFIDYNAGDGSDVALFAGIDPDLDDDGDVDGADFLALQRENPTLIPAWQGQFGSAPPAFAATAVPEPSGLVLMLSGLIAILVMERTK